ncbi:MAG: hypothetical protein EOM23_01970 [Candidatus Moranbacteria bacterium]|nr:hypothetical protein [Candidatus Moranbacteria bacterium]
MKKYQWLKHMITKLKQKEGFLSHKKLTGFSLCVHKDYPLGDNFPAVLLYQNNARYLRRDERGC